MKKLMMFIEIQQLEQQGLNIQQIAKELRISRTTVYKYLDMSPEEAFEWTLSLGNRKKRLDPYRDWILSWLGEHPHLSAAQIHDWLLERHPSLTVGESTVRLYVNQLREEHQIPKTARIRQYEVVPELPMGKQMQVDWGETRQKTPDKREVKLYCICFVLSHSRHKYVEWLDRPFTTSDAIRSHENAFDFFGGMPEELVYDQDHLLTVSENAGDLILTGAFQAYRQERGFRIYLCRKEDPESKGKVENVVKYVKRNFADSRIFTNIENWNERCQEWLERTGNQKVHQTTKKRPAEVFLLEKQHLQPISRKLSIESPLAPSITRTVNKDNTILYQSNRYSLPLGTYRPRGHNTVTVDVKESQERDQLVIRRSPGGEVLARHDVAEGKGKIIKNRNHGRDRSKGIQSFKEAVLRQFSSPLAVSFIERILEEHPRYKRDQLQVLQRATVAFPSHLEQALEKCVAERLWSANDFHDVANYLAASASPHAPNASQEEEAKKVRERKISVETRSLETYTEILEGMAK